MTESHFTNVKMATLGDAQKCTFTLQNTDVAYANTLRRLILTGVESVAFRSDMNDRGTSTDVSILKNSTSMTNEMLADRIGLIPIRWKTADGSPSDYVFSLQVKNTSDTTLDVTSSNITAVKLGKDGVETPVPTDSMKFFEKNILLAVLKPMRATHEPQEIAFTAKASYGIGKEHARFIPVSQCAYRYTRDTNEQKQKELMIEWAKKMNKINADEAGDVGKIDSKKLELLKKEYDTMEIDRCYLRNEKTQEANSFDFTVETLNTIDVVQVITNAIEKANNYDLTEDHRARLQHLFNMKRDMIKEILLLKSAFSIIDQMFNQEIQNAEVLRNRWLWGILYKFDKLPEPLKLNPFIENLMDPFKHADTVDLDTNTTSYSHSFKSSNNNHDDYENDIAKRLSGFFSTRGATPKRQVDQRYGDGIV